LQIVFHLHAVAIVLGVLRELFILIQQLRRIAASAAVNPVKLVAIAGLITIAATAATIISIIIQGSGSSSAAGKQDYFLHLRPTDPLSLRSAIRRCALRAAMPWTTAKGRFERIVELGSAVCALRRSSDLIQQLARLGRFAKPLREIHRRRTSARGLCARSHRNCAVKPASAAMALTASA
jgi:hypothetical protein